jgi:subtilisin inhibitor-like
MHALALIAVVFGLGGLLGCSSSGESDSAAAAEPGTANLRIAVWPQGKGTGEARRWRLRCGPVGGTLPARARACRRLLALERPFRPVPSGAACIQIYGGPEVAEVRGRLRGEPVASTFSRTDGCQIERWNRVRFLFPTAVSR